MYDLQVGMDAAVTDVKAGRKVIIVRNLSA
jgi:hypothetical protein